MYRRLIDWGLDNKSILAVGDIMSADEVYAVMLTKYSSWRSTFTVSEDDVMEKDDVLNMLWNGYISTTLPQLKNAVETLSKMTGKKEYEKVIDGTLKKTGNEVNTPNITDTNTRNAYADTVNDTSYVEHTESIKSSVAYNTLAEKEREKDVTDRSMPERGSTTNYGEAVNTNKRTGTDTKERDLTDKNDVKESGWETIPELIHDSIEYVNKQPVIEFIDRFVRQFFTFSSLD